MKKALITGITGQDGSYLSEFLLEKEYEVYGLVRRSSVSNLERIQHLLHNDNLTLLEGEVSDPLSVYNIMERLRPDEVYNLAAQSHVGTSFEQPDYTFQVDASGPLYFLEAIRRSNNNCKFYQASTSELFGSNFTISADGDNFQDEDTEFMPQSPYAVAKLAAHNLVRIYRDAYKAYACSGILFNHETLVYNTPLIFKDSSNNIDILPIGDIARFRTGVNFDMTKDYQGGTPQREIWVWDKNDWTKVKYVSGYPHKGDKNPRIINSRRSVYAATGSHVCIMEDDSEIKTSDLKPGNKVKLVDYPEVKERKEDITLEEAEWLGMMVGDGNLHGDVPRFTNKDQDLKDRFVFLWKSFVQRGRCKFLDSKSGFTGEDIGQVECYTESKTRYKKHLDIYTEELSPFGHKTKKVPKVILNSSLDVMEAFLLGYNACDGLKKNRCTYRFKNFKTNSHTLACGLLFLISKVTQQKYNITVEESWRHGRQQFYYSVNLLSDSKTSMDKYNEVRQLLDKNVSQRKIHRDTGISRSFIKKVKDGYVPNRTHHLEKQPNEIKKIIDIPEYNGWFFDLETESGTFQAGAGQGLVHNSERRGDQFVTRKITKWLGKFYNWEKHLRGDLDLSDKDYIYCSPYSTRFPKLRLGNLDAFRDWGHAEDYVRAMWMMLQQDQPDDFVISTGHTYSVRDFLTEAFSHVGIDNFDDYIVIDPKFYRPAEVDYLCGNSYKARKNLGWTPQVTFKDLVYRMVWSDIHAQEEKLSKISSLYQEKERY